jgi:hypothetical protein
MPFEDARSSFEDMRRRLISMEFKVSELEREPIDFDLELAPGAVDLGEEAEQVGNWPPAGPGRGAARAPRAQGHCGRHPAAGQFCGQVSGSLRALRGAGGDSAGAEFDLIFRPAEPIPRRRNGQLLRRKRKSVIIKRQSVA